MDAIWEDPLKGLFAQIKGQRDPHRTSPEKEQKGKDAKMERRQAEALLQQAVENPCAVFREGQWEAIDTLVNQRRRLLLVERTGWGKSAVYFLTTRILRDQGAGPALILSPLLALMRNQMDAANRLGLSAVTINSTNPEDWEAIRQEVMADRVDALLISPERLSNPLFVKEILEPLTERTGLFVVDEAHCISDWGHDFRPDYAKIVQVIRRLPETMPVLATTATANDRVVADVRRQLGDVEIRRGPLLRKSLVLQNLRMPGKAERLAWLATHIPGFAGSGIVYTLTRQDAEAVARWLRLHDIAAWAYHSTATHPKIPDSREYRSRLERAFLENRIKVLVATPALGMGYDKPDLGFVIHYQAPGSIVAYYQQVGRAGRGIDAALGVLLSGAEDGGIHRFFREQALPDNVHVNKVLAAISGEGKSVPAIQHEVNLSRGQVDQVLRVLHVADPAPVVKEGAKWRRTANPYLPDEGRVARLVRQREEEWEEVLSYLDNGGCLMRFLGRALDDPATAPCGKCAVCAGHPVVPEGFDENLAMAATRFLQQAEMVFVCKKQAEKGGFNRYGLPSRLPPELLAEKGRILCRLHDAGWGRAVAEDLGGGGFREEVITGVLEMLCTRWRPEPVPWCVTWVPPKNGSLHLMQLAEKIAERLGIAHAPLLIRVRENQPQREQKNRFYQCRNLDGVFTVSAPVPRGPVLLLDSVVGSGWTLTVAAALLRKAGSGPVYPLALASRRQGG